MRARPQCCQAATDADGIRWMAAGDWNYNVPRDTPAGWAIVVDWACGDTGCADEPLYGPIAFCPFCGAKGLEKFEIVADGSSMRGLADGSIKMGLGCGPLIPKRAIEVVPAPGDRCGGTKRIVSAGIAGTWPCPGCRACS